MLERKRGELNIKKLGEIIKIARNKLNLTLSDLSRISDISEIELWLLENGRIKNPKCVFLFRLSNILNLDYNELLKYRFASFYRKKRLRNVKYNLDKMILSEYKEWFEFSQLFRRAVTEISKIEYEGNDQGNFTTRDAALVKQIKDNESLPPEKIILYLFVQKKTMPYLNELNRIILSNSSEIKSNDTKKLIKTFGSIIESKGNN